MEILFKKNSMSELCLLDFLLCDMRMPVLKAGISMGGKLWIGKDQFHRSNLYDISI